MVRFPTKVSFVADEDEDIEMIASVFRDSRFETAIREALRSIVTPAETAEVVRDLLLSWVVSIEDAWNALVKYHNSLPPESPVGHGLRQVFDNWSIEWLFEHHDSEITWPKAAYRNCSFSQRKWEFFNSNGPLGERCKAPIPRPLCREAFIVHFCSGTRRDGDIQ